MAIQNTEISRQDILKAEAEKMKNKITLTTQVDVARIGKNITINQANATAMSKVVKVNATAGTFYNVQDKMAGAYAALKTNLTFANKDLINYLQVQLVKPRPDGQLLVNLPDDVPAAPKPPK